MLRYFSYLCLWFGAVVLATTQAQASHCADHATIVQRLAMIYGENRQIAETGPQNTLVEVFVAQHTGSWTIAVTRPDGLTCLVAAGQAFDWRRALVPAPETDV